MKPLVIANPRSANGKTGRHWPSLARRIREKIGDFDTVFTEGPRSASALARQAATEGRDWIIAVGGDGTVNEIVNGLISDDKPVNEGTDLSFIMRGTGNDFRRTLTGAKSLEQDLEALANGARRKIDAGKLTFTGHDGVAQTRYFNNIASFGMSGDVDRRVNDATLSKRLGGTAAFAIATVQTLLRYKNRPVRITADGELLRFERLRLGIVANGRFAGGGMEFAPTSRIDDGLFDLVVFDGIGPLDIVRSFRDVYNGRHLKHRRVYHQRCRKLTVESEIITLLDVDGEAPGRLPASFEVLPGALSVRC